MSFTEIECRIVGVSPMLMHNGRLADPNNVFAKQMKELTSKKKNKTDEDCLLVYKLEWLGGLYFDSKIGPYVPDQNIEGCIRDGARIRNKGKAVQAGVTITQLKIPLVCGWPMEKGAPVEPEKVWDSGKFVDQRMVVNPSTRARVLRTRPVFSEWFCEFVVNVDDELASAADVVNWLTDAGRVKGIMDGKPKFGRFVVERADIRKA